MVITTIIEENVHLRRMRYIKLTGKLMMIRLDGRNKLKLGKETIELSPLLLPFDTYD